MAESRVVMSADFARQVVRSWKSNLTAEQQARLDEDMFVVALLAGDIRIDLVPTTKAEVPETNG